MKQYKFEYIEVDEDTGSKTVMSMVVDNDCETWSGFDGPMWNFFNFLKGAGFVFGPDAMIGVLSNGKFIGAEE